MKTSLGLRYSAVWLDDMVFVFSKWVVHALVERSPGARRNLKQDEEFLSRTWICSGVPLHPIGIPVNVHLSQVEGGVPSGDLDVSPSGSVAAPRGGCTYTEARIKMLEEKYGIYVNASKDPARRRRRRRKPRDKPAEIPDEVPPAESPAQHARCAVSSDAGLL